MNRVASTDLNLVIFYLRDLVKHKMHSYRIKSLKNINSNFIIELVMQNRSYSEKRGEGVRERLSRRETVMKDTDALPGSVFVWKINLR